MYESSKTFDAFLYKMVSVCIICLARRPNDYYIVFVYDTSATRAMDRNF